MLKYLEEDIAEMTKQGHIPEAFSLCNYLFKAVSDVDMDDSDGGLMMFGDSTAEAWKEMISRADCEQKAAMFQWFRSHLDDYVIDYMEEYIEQVFYDAFEEKEYALQKLEIVDGLIVGKNEKDYGYEKLILRRVQIMEQSNLPFREIAAYCSGYEELSGVRQFLIHRFLSHRKKEKAIELLERSLILDQRYPGLVRQYRIQLKELYRESGETEKYRIQLWLLVTIDGDLDCFRELKALYSDAEWVTVSEKVYAETGACYIASFYAEEKRYDKLMQHVKAHPSIFMAMRYEKQLVKLYPEEILQIYKTELERAAEYPAGRSRYQEWARHLNHMKKIKGGSALVRTIVAGWRAQYKNRPAMMDELTNAGL